MNVERNYTACVYVITHAHAHILKHSCMGTTMLYIRTDSLGPLTVVLQEADHGLREELT